ncbi:hypothetical protein CC86DRAFT_16952 [Ophiobolus disseminans]|uniref:Uncharacterized protein n=1 Tax=Ophiobolus disseminans TaxID=1469910 RepID=A0A6A7AN28_9PLEO|nr:hypothetical protein CC86DRAFT_16952 [Ophiobolus disseminans]
MNAECRLQTAETASPLSKTAGLATLARRPWMHPACDPYRCVKRSSPALSRSLRPRSLVARPVARPSNRRPRALRSPVHARLSSQHTPMALPYKLHQLFRIQKQSTRHGAHPCFAAHPGLPQHGLGSHDLVLTALGRVAFRGAHHGNRTGTPCERAHTGQLRNSEVCVCVRRQYI